MRSEFVGEYYPLPDRVSTEKWFSIVWCLDNHQYNCRRQKYSLRNDVYDLKDSIMASKNKGKNNEQSSKPARFTHWLNVALNAEDIDYLSKQEPSGDDLLLELFTLIDAGYGFSSKLDTEAKCIVVYLFSPTSPDTLENCALSARSISGTDALSALFYKFEHKLRGEMVAPRTSGLDRFN